MWFLTSSIQAGLWQRARRGGSPLSRLPSLAAGFATHTPPGAPATIRPRQLRPGPHPGPARPRPRPGMDAPPAALPRVLSVQSHVVSGYVG